LVPLKVAKETNFLTIEVNLY